MYSLGFAIPISVLSHDEDWQRPLPHTGFDRVPTYVGNLYA